jgi:D-alanyl-lipoteichoic acid acyltransferase DltB (MBOAT superfamily)
MLFNSVEFLIFLPIVFTVYWFVLKNHLRLQNFFLLIAGYTFYGWWDWRFLFLLMLSSTVDYIVGISLGKTQEERKRKRILMLSISFNIGLLGFFKYFNFFADGFSDLMRTLGIQVNPMSLNVILPVGISFYTFQSLSYTIDVYKRKMEPTKDALAFYAFVSFFPQLVAGPIERAIRMLPQFTKKRTFDFDMAKDGVKQALWGMFKKVVIADNLAPYVQDIFNHHTRYNGSTLWLGVFYFAIQIYCDFSGYSDIAIGTARLFGFNIMRNFALPYFSRDIAEFWRRWHISLSTWFRDYVYIPLGGNRVSTLKAVRNVLITFTVSGFWHGANWTFIIWGFFNGLLFVPLLVMKKNKEHMGIVAEGRLLPNIKEILLMGLTFFFTLIAWVFFRSENISQSFAYLGQMFSSSLFELPSGLFRANFILVVILLVIEWIQRDKLHPLQIEKMPVYFRWIAYYTVLFLILNKGGHQESFIYFQF